MQENSTGALQVHPFFIWWLTTLASSSLHWDPVLSWKKNGARWKKGRAENDWRREKEEEKRREGERRSKFRVGGEYARVCECGEDEKEDREKWGRWRGKWERHRVGEKRKREYIATVSGIFKNFFCRQQSRVAATASPHPVVMYRWLFWAPNIHRSFPCANPHPPLSYCSHLHPSPPSILFYRCVLFFFVPLLIFSSYIAYFPLTYFFLTQISKSKLFFFCPVCLWSRWFIVNRTTPTAHISKLCMYTPQGCRNQSHSASFSDSYNCIFIIWLIWKMAHLN